MKMKHSLLFLFHPFAAVVPTLAWISSTTAPLTRFSTTSSCRTALGVVQADVLFEEEQEMVPIAEKYIHAKYRAVAASHGHDYCTKEDAREVLRSILPPVTLDELDDEVSKTLAGITSQKSGSNSNESDQDKIEEDDFVSAMIQNTYWQAAGNLVVKELMYFDALYTYYRTGSPLLNNDDYEVLKDNLTWEGSAVATMNAKEALFVTAVASARRGQSIMDDEEYEQLKNELKTQGSWVTDREQDALEKLGLNTFMGYLHRAL